jgi:N-acetyltransferase 10
MLPMIAQLYFTGRLTSEVGLSSVQKAVLIGIGLQKKDIESISKELSLPVSQTLAMFAKVVRKVSNYLRSIVASAIGETIPVARDDALDEMDGLPTSSNGPVDDEDEEEDAEEQNEKTIALRQKQRELIDALDLQKYAVSNDADWEADSVKKAATGKGTVALKSTKKDNKRKQGVQEIYEQEMATSSKKKHKHR